MRQAENEVFIEGILSESNIKEDISKKTNKPYIMGEIKIRVPVTISGVESVLEIPVRLFANQKTNKGLPNPAYDSIKKISDMISVASCGGDADKADRVRIERAAIGMNEFYSQRGDFVSYPIIRGTFVKKVRPEDYEPRATFSTVIVVAGLKEEVNPVTNDLTGRLNIIGILPQYGDTVDVVNFFVENQAAINHISTYYQKGDTVRVAGIPNFSYTVEKEVVEMGFGEPEIRSKTKQIHDLIVTKGSQGALDAEFAYDNEEISKALAVRQATLTEMKNSVETKAKAAASAANAAVAKGNETDFGF